MKKITDQQLKVLFPMAINEYLQILFDKEINRYMDTDNQPINFKVFLSLHINGYVQHGVLNDHDWYCITPKGVDAVRERCNTKLFRTLERKYGMMPNKNKGKP